MLQDLRINIHGVNILQPAFPLEKEIPYKHYHLEITATNKQEMNLKERLLTGLAIDNLVRLMIFKISCKVIVNQQVIVMTLLCEIIIIVDLPWPRGTLP